MSERTFSTFKKATEFSVLMKKFCGREVAVIQHGPGWVVRPSFGRQTIVEVTEALLRQVGK
jgi:hypothetical protein